MLEIRQLGLTDYQTTWQAMKEYTDNRTQDSPDQIWFLEHYPVFTQGQNGNAKHIIDLKNIPLIKSDRGGQITYHGPGQLIAYVLIDLKRLGLSIRPLATLLENSIIELLAGMKIRAIADPKAPGVYIESANTIKRKIASVGLRVRKGCSYHGLSLNVAMDLKPFTYIHPCGFSELLMTQIRDEGGPTQVAEIIPHLKTILIDKMRFCSL